MDSRKKEKNYAQDYLQKQTQVAVLSPGTIDCTKFDWHYSKSEKKKEFPKMLEPFEWLDGAS